MLMTYLIHLMSYVLCLIHLMYLYLMLGRVMLTCGSFALVYRMQAMPCGATNCTGYVKMLPENDTT